MGLLKKLLSGKNVQTTKSSDERIAVYFKVSNDGCGTEEERKFIHQFTDKLAEVILNSGSGIFDGDEFGNGECGCSYTAPMPISYLKWSSLC